MNKYVNVEDVKDLINGLDSLPWEDEVDEMVDGLAAADVVEVKRGAWINVQDFGGGKCFADCSVCRTQEKAPNPTAFKMFRRYCSYCGAKMDLKEGVEG